jgi:hypothetical protein
LLKNYYPIDSSRNANRSDVERSRPGGSFPPPKGYDNVLYHTLC